MEEVFLDVGRLGVLLSGIKVLAFDVSFAIDVSDGGEIVRSRALQSLLQCTRMCIGDELRAAQVLDFLVGALERWRGGGALTVEQAVGLKALGFSVSPERVF